MPAATRAPVDICTGHGCFPPRNTVSGSVDTYNNDFQAYRVGDPIAVHCCVTCHSSVLCSGSPDVYVNDLQWGRVGDPICCGGSMATGSSDTYLNG